MDSNIYSSISHLSVSYMNDNQIAIVNNLQTLISVKGFVTNEINDLVNQLSVM